MLGSVDLGFTHRCKTKIIKYATRFGHEWWPLIYQADARASNERATMWEMEVSVLYMNAKGKGVGEECDYNPARHCNYIFSVYLKAPIGGLLKLIQLLIGWLLAYTLFLPILLLGYW